MDCKNDSCQRERVIIYWKNDESRQDNNGEGCIKPGFFSGVLHTDCDKRERMAGACVGVHTGTAFHSDGANGLF